MVTLFFRPVCRTVIVLALFTWSVPGRAWEERGHRAVTSVACRLIHQEAKDGARFSKPFFQRETMLGHLSNIPDIMWRSIPLKLAEANLPTHYVDLEYLSEQPSMNNIPLVFAEAEKLAAQHHKDLKNEVGTAPWRVKQLADAMKVALQKAKNVDAEPPTERSATFERAVNEALLNAGIMSHFVGDLSNPYHTTRNHDGWETGNGGVHRYFETALVMELPLSLEGEVYDFAQKNHPLKAALAALPDKERQEVQGDPLRMAFFLALNSHARLKDAIALDTKLAVISPSGKGAPRKPAIRKPAAEVMEAFKPIIIERLAIGAEALAMIWEQAWESASKPDLSKFKSYAYFLTPEFIVPRY